MNAPLRLAVETVPALHRVVLAALADRLATAPACAERDWLQAESAQVTGDALAQWLAAPPEADTLLHGLVCELSLNAVEALALALAVAVEFDPMLSRVVAWLQAPAGGARPTLGLLNSVADVLGQADALPALLDGAARAAGVLQLETASRPLPELAFHVPVPLALALRGHVGTWPGARVLPAPPAPLPASLRDAATREADALQQGVQVLALRSGHPRETLQAAALVAQALGRQPVCFDEAPAAGAGAWLWLRRAVPVLRHELAPGETRALPALPGYRGPLLLACGLEGSVERDGDPVPSWHVPLPTAEERCALWAAHLPATEAQRLGQQHRHSAAHIGHLARAAQRAAQLAGQARFGEAHVREASRAGAAGELGTLAQLLTDAVPAEALVVSPELRAALGALQQRCERRETLAHGLGPSARTRYRPGVRALLVGPSGTGKTLAVGWLATRLGLPLYRVDLASVASKYIGETEKNLAQLFARAEHAEVVLLFDEADALFGKRTDVKDSNDRFANQQTNYLLQRIETFDGIAVLTSNSRARFDSAFTRRLDAIIDFPAPGPEERRALWLAHLGAHHTLDAADINRLAACCDLAGGHIRNATLAAAALAAGPVDLPALRRGVEAEYRKLGRQVPAAL